VGGGGIELGIRPEAPGEVVCRAGNRHGAQQALCRLRPRVRVEGDEFEWTPSGTAPEGQGAVALVARDGRLALRFALVSREPGILDLSLEISPEGRGRRSVDSCAIEVDFLPRGLPLPAEDEELLDDCCVPHLVPKPGLVMADMIFRSPAIAVRKAERALALLPDLDSLARSRPAPWALDFDRRGPRGVPRLWLGLAHCRPHGHVYFQHLPEREIEIPREGVALRGQLIASATAGDDFGRRVQRFLWQRYGTRRYRAVSPQVLSFDDSGRAALARLFERDDLYFEFDHQGARCAGVAAHACTSRRRQRPLGALATRVASPLHGLGIRLWLDALNLFGLSCGADDLLHWCLDNLGIPFIAESQFGSWFNNLRTAYGARVLAERWGDQRLSEQAGCIKRLALSAPVEDGIFAAVCSFPGGRVWWHRGTLAFRAIDDYHTPDQATTGTMMLRWYRDIEPDARLLAMARGLGHFFAKHQLPSGAVPAWIEGGSHRHLPRLLESASTAGPLMFMATLASLDDDERWLASARRMADFIERSVLPDHRWYDYETFFSCSRQRRPPRDPRTGVLPQSTQSKWWAAEGARLLARVTGEARYRELLLRCLDDLLWHQQVWDAPYLSIDTFGGFGSMNTDAEWNDARQGCIAPVLLDSYLETRDPHHFERGVAALRACYTTMLHPAMREVAAGNMVRYRERDRGAIYENYAHLGFDRVCAGYLEPDWGAGTAAYATAHAAHFYGDLFVDLDPGHAFGLNGCSVLSLERVGDEVRLELASQLVEPADLRVVIRGADRCTRLVVNGARHSFQAFERR